MDDTERAELIAALHPAATFAEALLDLNERLLNVLASGENRPDCEELEYLRAGLVAPAQVPERLARVQVGVRSASTNAVIEGATVRLLPERGPQQTCTTGDDGICQFWTARMPVAVAVSKDGFVPTETPFTLADTCYCAGGLITLVEAPR
jgi:hypothetical protein